MAPETYYYFFSLIAVIAVLTHVSNMLFFRAKNKTIFGQKYKIGSVEYLRLKKYSSTPYLTFACLLELLFATNLVYDIHRILNLGKPEYAHFILIFAPVVTILSFIALLFYAYNMFYKKG